MPCLLVVFGLILLAMMFGPALAALALKGIFYIIGLLIFSITTFAIWSFRD